jgi:hypothetical protein
MGNLAQSDTNVQSSSGMSYCPLSEGCNCVHLKALLPPSTTCKADKPCPVCQILEQEENANISNDYFAFTMTQSPIKHHESFNAVLIAFKQIIDRLP